MLEGYYSSLGSFIVKGNLIIDYNNLKSYIVLKRLHKKNILIIIRNEPLK